MLLRPGAGATGAPPCRCARAPASQTVASSPTYLYDRNRLNWEVLAVGFALAAFIATIVLLSLLMLVNRWVAMLEAEHKQLASMRTAMHLQRTTLGFIAHNVRNPAHVIATSVDFLRDVVGEGAPGRDDLENIVRGSPGRWAAGRRRCRATPCYVPLLLLCRPLSQADSTNDIHRLLSDIMNMRALEEGKLEIKLTLYELRALLARMATNHRSMSRVPLHWAVDAEVPALIIGDPLRVQQIGGCHTSGSLARSAARPLLPVRCPCSRFRAVVNGITNACKHCMSGAITIRARLLPPGALADGHGLDDGRSSGSGSAVAGEGDGTGATKARRSWLPRWWRSGRGSASVAPLPSPSRPGEADVELGVAAASSAARGSALGLRLLCIEVEDSGPGLARPAEQLFSGFVTGGGGGGLTSPQTPPTPPRELAVLDGAGAGTGASDADAALRRSAPLQRPTDVANLLASSSYAAWLRGERRPLLRCSRARTPSTSLVRAPSSRRHGPGPSGVEETGAGAGRQPAPVP